MEQTKTVDRCYVFVTTVVHEKIRKFFLFPANKKAKM